MSMPEHSSTIDKAAALESSASASAKSRADNVLGSTRQELLDCNISMNVIDNDWASLLFLPRIPMAPLSQILQT